MTAPDLPPIPALNPLLSTLPPKFSTLRDYQIPVIMDILDHFRNGEKVVVLDAPTGSGKTVIAEVVRLMLRTEGVYVAHTKDLQTQFAKDFTYSRVLWGRANYLPERAAVYPGATCGDCDGAGRDPCTMCSTRDSCPYELAKADAARSPVPVLNMAYWLTAARGRGPFTGRGLTVVDEMDVLEKVLLGQVTVTISARRAARYRIDPPATLTKESSHAEWIAHAEDRLMSALRRAEPDGRGDPAANRERLVLTGLLSRLRGMRRDLETRGGGWVYTGGAGSGRRRGETIEFRPVVVDRFGREEIWGKDDRFLLMSGSVISPGMRLAGLGWDGSYGYVRIDSQFPAKNRPVVVRPTVDMGRGQRDATTIPRLVGALGRILSAHPNERVLVHCVSYDLASTLSDALCGPRPVFTYTDGSGRAEALRTFRETPDAVILAPSLDRGIDLPDDLCRVVVIAKVPYPNLGDRQVSKRLYETPNGKTWYQVEVAATLLQMTGRAVRHVDDWATCYILDSSFTGWWRQWQYLMPKWWRQAVRFER